MTDSISRPAWQVVTQLCHTQLFSHVQTAFCGCLDFSCFICLLIPSPQSFILIIQSKFYCYSLVILCWNYHCQSFPLTLVSQHFQLCSALQFSAYAESLSKSQKRGLYASSRLISRVHSHLNTRSIGPELPEAGSLLSSPVDGYLHSSRLHPTSVEICTSIGELDNQTIMYKSPGLPNSFGVTGVLKGLPVFPVHGLHTENQASFNFVGQCHLSSGCSYTE